MDPNSSAHVGHTNDKKKNSNPEEYSDTDYIPYFRLVHHSNRSCVTCGRARHVKYTHAPPAIVLCVEPLPKMCDFIFRSFGCCRCNHTHLVCALHSVRSTFMNIIPIEDIRHSNYMVCMMNADVHANQAIPKLQKKKKLKNPYISLACAVCGRTNRIFLQELVSVRFWLPNLKAFSIGDIQIFEGCTVQIIQEIFSVWTLVQIFSNFECSSNRTRNQKLDPKRELCSTNKMSTRPSVLLLCCSKLFCEGCAEK